MSDGVPAALPKSPPAPDPFVGRVINDRFRITGLIARGGMGRVYRAEQAPLGRICAVKVLNPNVSAGQDIEFHKRLFLEASTASKLTHPNTVTIFDYGRTEDDVYFMAMEYLEGRTLHRAIRQAGSMPEERAGHIARQICRALHEAHSMGVIHRDLKPANIYLVEHGDEPDYVKVLDFGLVKDVSETRSEELTQAGLFMGSPKYMAPEQVRGERVDARTDIYSLGVILYEMITGKVPFDRPTSVHILMAHVHEAPAPMRQVNPQAQFSAALEETVAKCLAKDPDQRYRSMDEVLAALKRVAGATYTQTLAQLPESALRVLAAAPSAPSGSLPAVGNETGPTPFPTAPTVTSPSPATGSSVLAWQQPVGRRSHRALATGVAAAVVVGAFVGYITVRSDRPQVRAAATPAAAALAPAAAVSAAPVSNSIVKVRISSDPDGATVKENGVAICMSTPCDVLYADADPERVHEITVSLAGYRPESRGIKVGDSPVLVQLSVEP